MHASQCLFALCLLLSGEPRDPSGSIRGVAVNGTRDQEPLGQAEVVLRAGQQGAFATVAATMTDAAGRFAFTDLPLDEATVYLAGVNRDGIHYPGPRVRLTPRQADHAVTLVAFDAVAAPSPLICRLHEFRIRPEAGHVEITETLAIDNPTRTTFVGEAQDHHPPVTLRISVPAGLEKVTFEKEFHGRNFQFVPGGLATQIPWLPGAQELRLIYRIPADQREFVYRRTLDLVTEQLKVQVVADPAAVACNLPAAGTPAPGTAAFARSDSVLPAGHVLELRLGDRPIPWEVTARWAALATLLALVAASAWVSRRRQRGARPRIPSGAISSPHSPSSPRPPRQSRRSGQARSRSFPQS